MGVLIDFLHWLPRYFFPKICYGCGSEGMYVCSVCRTDAELVLDSPICPSCSKPSPKGFVHAGCPKRGKLNGLVSYYHYSGWAAAIVREAKFGRQRNFRAMLELTEEFGASLQSEAYGLRPTVTDGWILVPVPLHWWRRRKRGFNQAALIARKLRENLQFPVNEKLLERLRYTEPQTRILQSIKLKKKLIKELEKKYPSETQRRRETQKLKKKIAMRRRKKNVKNAFGVKAKMADRNVLLVDDVWTTGATMQECARVLKRAGAKTVWGITLLRA